MSTEQSVGYGRPPSSTRFRKGQSGNPKGRPRNRSREIPYDAVLGQMVTIREDGRESRSKPISCRSTRRWRPSKQRELHGARTSRQLASSSTSRSAAVLMQSWTRSTLRDSSTPRTRTGCAGRSTRGSSKQPSPGQGNASCRDKSSRRSGQTPAIARK